MSEHADYIFNRDKPKNKNKKNQYQARLIPDDTRTKNEPTETEISAKISDTNIEIEEDKSNDSDTRDNNESTTAVENNDNGMIQLQSGTVSVTENEGKLVLNIISEEYPFIYHNNTLMKLTDTSDYPTQVSFQTEDVAKVLGTLVILTIATIYFIKTKK